ncbi:MAG: hypothetical protein JWL71_3184 [Acidobacteria bacterium]|nr:hypothetical protein [Acidobacteriota bacterium]
MLKITRLKNAGTTTLIVSGRIDAGQLRDLRRLVESEHASDVVLDLSEVSLVDVEVVRFLLQCETQGMRLARCPAYVHEWMIRENFRDYVRCGRRVQHDTEKERRIRCRQFRVSRTSFWCTARS